MATALASDLRMRVMVDVEAGMSAEKYSVSARTIYHWKAFAACDGGR